MTANKIASFRPYALSLLRIIAGFGFCLHGFQKIFGVLGGAGGSGQPAQLLSLAWVAGILELVGGLLILVGLFTAPVAFILSGQMAVAYFQAHAPRGFWPIENRGELAMLYSFLFLYLFTAGPGPWSLDRLLRKKKNS
jgi:putative oxidoreductase